jgi:hypothetical protein
MIFARGQIEKEAFCELLGLQEAKMVVSAQNNSYVYCYMPISLSTDIECKESAKNNNCPNREENRNMTKCCSLQIYEGDGRKRGCCESCLR